ncbi:MAG TPA: hypothetical protein VEB21_07760 [Terriglobales bacterium]|nr:hypothetical protein [Terriglobales bacterium]
MMPLIIPITVQTALVLKMPMTSLRERFLAKMGSLAALTNFIRISNAPQARNVDR